MNNKLEEANRRTISELHKKYTEEGNRMLEKEKTFISLCQSSFPSNAIAFKQILFYSYLNYYHCSFCGSEQQIICESFIACIHKI